MFGTAVLLLLFAALTPWACLAQQTCYIKPRSDTRCPGEPCSTLSQYTDEQINAYTTLLFLPGTHYLNNRITFTGIDNISLLRDQSSDPQLRIVCNNSAFFKFIDIDNLYISGFDFVSCGSDLYWGILIHTVNYCQLINFSMQEGGGVLIDNSLVSFSGNTNFVNNSDSAVVVRYDSTVTFTGKCNFAYNSALYYGGAVLAYVDVMLNFTGTSTFIGNSVLGVGGAIIAVTNVTMIFSGSSQFLNNSADYGGGAVFISDNSILALAGNVSFANNTAQYGGGIFIENGCSIVLLGNSFITNQGKAAGGAVYAMDSYIFLFGNNHFKRNTANFGGSIWVENSYVYFTGTNTFRSNSALGGGGIYALESVLNFRGEENMFENNSAHDGGALSLSADTKYILQSNTTLYFNSNRAEQFGGAIRVEVRDFEYCAKNLSSSSNNISIGIEERYFLRFPNGDSHVQMIFTNNYAKKAGSVLFGGSLHIRLQYEHIFNDTLQDNSTSLYSSYPFKICACNENKEVNCTNPRIDKSAYPGQKFNVLAAVVEEREGMVPALVQVLQGRDIIEPLQTAQETNERCTLEFTVFSNSSFEILSLSAQGPCFELNTFSVNVTLKDCPRGFDLSNKTLACDCEERLQPYTDTCNIDDQTIHRTGRFWVGFDNESEGIILYEICPFYYCVDRPVDITLDNPDEDYSLNVSVNNTDMQCDSNRAGLLCGECKPGFSLTLGNPHCWECSNRYLALLIPFAVAGVVIVLLLYVLDLTVPHGTLSGLIFYANIVSVTWRAFPREDYFFPRMFIAWLNLDLGIETCFYDGLDAYVKTWLQFVFPIYIWALVGVIVIISHYSSKVTKLLGTNSVSVLATLLFLTYTKILRTIIIALAFAYLEYPNNETRVMWLYDANIEYLKGKHIVLFVAALVFFLVLFTPYTLFLIFGQWLLAKSHLRMFNWVNRLKPFLDAYHSPYKPNHRYWPGLLLFVRCILSVALAFNITGDLATLDFLYVCTGAIVVLTWGWVAGGMYKNWYLDALEASFVLNLGLFAASCYQTVTEERSTVTTYSNKKHKAIAYTFTGVAFLEFLGILAYHIYLKFRHANPNMNRKQLQLSLTQFVRRRSSLKEEDMCYAESSFANGEGIESSRSPTISYISFTTSESTDASDPQLSQRPSFYDASLIREPLLGNDLNEQS